LSAAVFYHIDITLAATTNQRRPSLMHDIWKFQAKAQYTSPTPTRRNCRVASRVGIGDYSQLAHDDCGRIRSTIWKLNLQQFDYANFDLIDIDNFFNNDVIISSTVQEIVNWVTTADGCVHTADTTQLDFAVGKFVQTRRDCRQLVANSVHTADATQFDS